ncbi:DUF6445 family protein [Sphingomonas sp. G-3-2-10]|uniref:DUF6445 family protein n=1 Tax=Sphingomonas sp. G-3-2-10 TaxID=2728838 RepID=UPI00146A2E0B|nr:DUF6445 family protein [Sphingomonas sp. G-3-2-10]NML05694.1 hypothetical protein [Sphingomonas sp. G-3-2-10]
MTFDLNPRPVASLTHAGHDREPVLQVDGLMLDPETLIEFAAGGQAFAPAYGPNGGYPGIRAPAPLPYVETVARGLDPLVREAFGLRGVALAHADCNLSLVTLAPGELVPPQRVPHIDTTYPLQFAFLHYLCGTELGGTALYRHRATGYEALTPERLPRYETIRLAEAEAAPGYITGDTDHFEQTAALDAAFNRLIVYRSCVLHSGRIPADAALSPDPRQGRLTANIFLSYRAA